MCSRAQSCPPHEALWRRTGRTTWLGLPGDVDRAGDAYFHDLGAADLTALKALACPTTTITLTQSQLDQITGATPDGPAVESGGTATETGTLRASDGSSAEVTAYLKQQSDGWCLDHTSGT